MDGNIGGTNYNEGVLVEDSYLRFDSGTATWTNAPAYRGMRTTLTARDNLTSGTTYPIQLDAISDTFNSWDADGMLDSVNEEIDILEIGLYEIDVGIFFNGLVAAASSRFIGINAYLVHNGVTNRINEAVRLYPQTASVLRTPDFSEKFTVTNIPSYVHMTVRVYDGGANTADLVNGTVEIERAGPVQ